MSGRIEFLASQPPPRHSCDPPPAVEPHINHYEVVFPVGTLWLCDCGQGWVVDRAGGREWRWRKESRSNRHRRLRPW
jgi:hypothetical protein